MTWLHYWLLVLAAPLGGGLGLFVMTHLRGDPYPLPIYWLWILTYG